MFVKVCDAVAARRSIRAFLPTAVDRAVLERVLNRARYAPSGGNVQPWHAVVVAGDALAAFKAGVAAKLAVGEGLDHHYRSYPDALPDPWMARRRQCAAELYAAVGVERGDKEARDAQTARNWVAFDAPCIMFCHTPLMMERAQWADMGIWLQTVMLLLQEEGLDTCAQGAWGHSGTMVRELLGIGDDHAVYCGLSIGHADAAAPVNSLRTSRAPIEENVRFMGI